jgi:putative salt-induced outer membrane protein
MERDDRDFTVFSLAPARHDMVYSAPVFMRKSKIIALAAGILAACSLSALAQQTETVTVTNVITVTNIVIVTNIVPPAPAPAASKPAETLPPVVKYPWESSISAGLTMTRGNSHTLLYTGNFQTDKKTPDNEYKLGVGGAYGSQDSKETVNNYGGFGQWNHLFTDRFYGYIRVDALRDVIADLDYRVNIGPGAGYYFIKSAATMLSAEAGAGMQYEHLGGNYSSFGTLRLAENFEHKFNDRARLWEKAEILPQVDKFQNYVANFEIGIEASVTKTLSLKTYLDDSYQSEPAPGRYRNDMKIVSALAYKF